MTRANSEPRSALSTTVFGVALLSASAVSALAGVLFAVLVWQANQILIDDVLAGIEREAGGLVALSVREGDAAVARRLEDQQRANSAGLYHLSENGAYRAGSLRTVPGELLAAGGRGLFSFTSEAEPAPRLAAGRIETLAGGGILVVARDIENQRRLGSRLRWLAVAGFALIGLAAAGSGLVVARRVLRRVEEMAATSRAIMAGDLARRLPAAGSDDELDRLAHSLNLMLDRIDELMTGMREVSDNIAHDLKTPLNRLRNRAETALREATSPQDLRLALGETIEAADAIIKTFNALLLIARLESGAVEDTKDVIDAGALVASVVELYAPVAEDEGQSLVLSAERSATVRANPHLLAQAVANLIDNALKYARARLPVETHAAAVTASGTPARSQPIVVEVGRAGGRVCIAVADRGPGIPASERQHALTRFGRLERSRSTPGTGLGLNLVAAVARLHEGRLRLEDNAPGLRAVLELPAVDPVAPVGAE
ncbi:MAG: ATP-binding protein [Hyphomicrobiaceae bacterium]|nr:ATP-binding protein [Hyphomicrobiaceae bacterium]